MNFLIGLFISTASIIAAIIHLQTGFSSYYDFVAIAVVLGGTFAVAIITFPWKNSSELRRRLGHLFFKKSTNRKLLLSQYFGHIQNYAQTRSAPEIKVKDLKDEVIRDGFELGSLGFTPDKIRAILEERIYRSSVRTHKLANSIRSLAKYPPAFGLAGTVLGLIHLMRGISEGMDPAETGFRMAIALLATFYGLIVSNMIVNPAGESVQKFGEEDEAEAEIALEAVILAIEQKSLLEAQELLNSHVPPGDRVDIIHQRMQESMAESEAA